MKLTHRYPVLLAVDEAQALFSRSEYHSPQFDALEAYHLSTPLLVLDYLTGRKAFVSPHLFAKHPQC